MIAFWASDFFSCHAFAVNADGTIQPDSWTVKSHYGLASNGLRIGQEHPHVLQWYSGSWFCHVWMLMCPVCPCGQVGCDACSKPK